MLILILQYKSLSKFLFAVPSAEIITFLLTATALGPC